MEREETQEQKNPSDHNSAAKTAFLVIHGIGQQEPFETLDGFVRGFRQALSRKTGRPWTIRHDLLKMNDSTESRLHLSPDGEDKRKEKPGEFDVYEVCWAALTQREISYVQVLWFLQRAALSPLRYFATNFEFLAEEKRAGRRTKGPMWIMGREFLRMGLIYLPVLFLLLALGTLLPNAADLQNVASLLATPLKDGLPKGIGTWTLFYMEILLWMLLGVTGRSFLDTIKKGRLESINRRAETRWRNALTFFFLLFLVLLVGKVWLNGSSVWVLLASFSLPLWMGLVAFLLYGWTKGILVDFIGDITIYVNMDENSEFFRTRNAILCEAADKLRWLLKQDQYDRIFVAGHSLGSVVAHNAINKLLLEVEREGNNPEELSWKELEKIRLLITFGSPLDKVYYFFRTHVQSDQAIRAQILSDRYPFARRPSRTGRIDEKMKHTAWVREYGDVTFCDPPSPMMLYPDQKAPSRQFTWLNFWYPTDPVSGHLDFYDPKRLKNEKLNSPWRRFGIAHLDYWSDPIFYDKILEQIHTIEKSDNTSIKQTEQPSLQSG